MTLYELRHTFVSVVKALPDRELQPIIGHSPSMDTTGVYSHEIAGEMKTISGKITNLFDHIISKEKSEEKKSVVKSVVKAQ